MNHKEIITRLSANIRVFKSLLNGLSEEEYLFKPAENKWCILEVVCHLHDEECEDFRARLKHVLDAPDKPLPPIDPVGWVKERNYIEQNYEQIVEHFLSERDESLMWLQSLTSPKWKNAYKHPTFGSMSAEMFLANWVAHDYFHFRQITSLKYQYLMNITDQNLLYAGTW
jgi:hypothetical protein